VTARFSVVDGTPRAGAARGGATLLLLLLLVAVAGAQTGEVLGEVRVHGNHTTPDADVLSIAALSVGAPVDDATLHAAQERLEKSGRFSSVEVRKRYRSLDNPSDILVIVLVDELPGVSEDDLTPGALKRFTSSGMWLPILDYEDGYGFTYGARVSLVNSLGPRSRISFPATWGGERRAAMEVDRTFVSRPLTRLHGDVSISRRENPHYEIGDTRRQVSGRAERALTPWLRIGGGGRFTDVNFGGTDDDGRFFPTWHGQYFAPGADVVIDTRVDPAFPRNAIHAAFGIEQLRFVDDVNIRRWTGDASAYVGLIGSSVLAVRALTSQVNQILPAFEQALLGGEGSLRGYDVGYRAGDNLAAFSAEVRVPLTSPLSIGRLGMKTFVDMGTVYNHGAKLADQRFDRGIGGGVFFTATVVRAGLDVAWPEGSSSPSWHFGLGVTF